MWIVSSGHKPLAECVGSSVVTDTRDHGHHRGVASIESLWKVVAESTQVRPELRRLLLAAWMAGLEGGSGDNKLMTSADETVRRTFRCHWMFLAFVWAKKI